nr:hypothetical protein [Rhizosolenia setigera]
MEPKNYNKKHLKTFFLTVLMLNGKKNITEKILLKKIKLFNKLTKKNFNSIITVSLKNNYPLLFRLNLKRRNRLIPIPILIKSSKRIRYLFKIFAIQYKKKSKSNISIDNYLFSEFLDSSKNIGSLKKINENEYQNCFLNKTFINFKWF